MGRKLATADVFVAIADPTRRRILGLLCEGERPAMELVRPFHISQPTVSNHLRILREAGLVRMRQKGRQRYYSLRADPLREIANWVVLFEKFWEEKFGALGAYLDKRHGAKKDESAPPTES